MISIVLQYFVAFLSQVFLARILEPEHFGVLAFVTMVTMFFDRFTNLFGDKYIVREKEDIFRKLDSVFTLELILAFIVSALFIFFAPIIMELLDRPKLTIYVQVLSIAFFYNALSKPRSLFEKNLVFLKVKYPQILSKIISGIIGIILAYLGYGVWSLIIWKLAGLYIEVALIWIITPYRPRLRLNQEHLKGIIAFGWPLLGSSIFVFYYWNVDYYIVGQLLSAKTLGYYWMAYQVSHYFLSVKASLISVVFPAFSMLRDKNTILQGFNVLTKITLILYAFPTIITFLLGDQLIELVFGEKWLPAVDILKIFMVLTTWRAVTSYWDPVFMFYERTKILFNMTILNAVIITFLGYHATLIYGMEGMAAAVLVSIVIVSPIAAFQLKKIIDVSYTKILGKSLAVIVILAFLFKLVLFMLVSINGDSIFAILFSTFIFTLIYFGLFIRLNRDIINDVKIKNK